MKKDTQLNDIFYKKTRVLLDLVLWMQDSKKGVTIEDIMKRFSVSKRTAVRMKDSVKVQFPQVMERTSAHNKKHWYIPKEGVKDYVTSSFSNLNVLRNTDSKQLNKNFTKVIINRVKKYLRDEEQRTALNGQFETSEKERDFSIACLKRDDYMLDNLIKLNKELTTQDKIKKILLLAKKQGHGKLTARQLVIAYYVRYTMDDRNDFQDLTQMRKELSEISAPYKELIYFDDKENYL